MPTIASTAPVNRRRSGTGCNPDLTKATMTGPREPAMDAAQDEGITPLQLRQMLQLQRALLDVAAGARPTQQRIDEACRCFEAAVPGAVASVMLLDMDGLLQVFSAPSIPPEIAARLNDLTPGPRAGSCGNVIYRQEPVFVSDTLSDPRWADLRPLALDHQLKACWSMPLRDRDQRIVGTFALTSFAHGLPHAFERQLLELGASTLALLLQQRDEEVDRDAREERLRRLADFNALHAAVNQVVASCEDVTAFLQSICELAVRHAGLKLTFVARPDESGRFRFLASAGDAVGYLDDLLISADPDVPEGQGSTGKTWREGRPYYNQSFAATAYLSPWHARALRFGLDASATQPIMRSGRI